MTPQPLAVTTIASAPRSTCGHHASMLRFTMRAARVLRAQVIRQRAAAAAAGTRTSEMPIAVEHAGHRGVDVGRERALHATVEREHLARVAVGGPDARNDARPGSRAASSRGRSDFTQAPRRNGGAEQRGPTEVPRRIASAAPARRASGGRLVDDVAPDVEQAPVT